MELPKHTIHDSFLQYAIITSACLALLSGYLTSSFKNIIVVYGLGIFLTMLVVVPDWAFFLSRPPSQWIEPMASDPHSRKLQQERFPILKKTAKYAKREDVHPLGILLVITGFIYSLYFTWKFITS